MYIHAMHMFMYCIVFYCMCGRMAHMFMHCIVSYSTVCVDEWCMILYLVIEYESVCIIYTELLTYIRKLIVILQSSSHLWLARGPWWSWWMTRIWPPWAIHRLLQRSSTPSRYIYSGLSFYPYIHTLWIPLYINTCIHAYN